MPENLLAPSRIKLYGRPMADVILTPLAKAEDLPNPPPRNSGREPPYRYGDNHFLRRQLAQPDARLARIYSYSYEGEYYRLGVPAILLVHGDGEDPNVPEPAIEKQGTSARAANVARGPNTVHRTGAADQDWEFAADIRMWEYDQADFSLRMEMVSGPLEDILLEAEVQMASGSGRVQVSGAGRVQVSGAGRVQVSHAGRMQIAHRGGKLE